MREGQDHGTNYVDLGELRQTWSQSTDLRHAIGTPTPSQTLLCCGVSWLLTDAVKAYLTYSSKEAYFIVDLY